MGELQNRNLRCSARSYQRPDIYTDINNLSFIILRRLLRRGTGGPEAPYRYSNLVMKSDSKRGENFFMKSQQSID